MATELRPYQIRMLTDVRRNLSLHHGAQLWADPGLGKTVVAATAALGDFPKVLVVAPLKVAQLTWPAELRRWPWLRTHEVFPLSGPPARRSKALQDIRQADRAVGIINYELLEWLQGTLNTDRSVFDVVIFDEVDKLKSPTAKRFKAARKLPVAFRIGMTGTPGTEGLLDLWAQATAVKDGSLGRSFYEWRATYFRARDPRGFTWTPLRETRDHVLHKLKPFTSVFEAKDYLDLPEVLVVDHRIAPTQKLLDVYKPLERDFVAQVHDQTVDALSEGTLFAKLRQVASGFIYTPEGTITLDAAKYEKLQGLVEELQGQPLLIVYAFRAQADELRRRYPDIGVIGGGVAQSEAEDLLRRWNDGRLRLLAIHPAAAGHGLNLQEGGAHQMVFLTLPTSGREYLQTIGRLQRLGQKRGVVVHRLITADTLEPTVARKLETKTHDERGMMMAVAQEVRA